MKLFYRCTLCVGSCVVLLVGSNMPAVSQCVTGTVSAEFKTTGPFAGLWKYTLDFSWDLPQGLSNVTLDCGIGHCGGEVCSQTYLFDTPSGTSTGVDGGGNACVVDYAGEYNCLGNPSIGLSIPIVKWDALNNLCEPGPVGSGTLCFFTLAPPHFDAKLPIVLIKNGQNLCYGMVFGACPIDCTVPIEESSWGEVKAKYSNER